MVTNNRGGLTLDFIFALVLVTGLSSVLLAIGLTLAMVEVSQYIAFATSRVYFGAHVDRETQEDIANAKFTKLMEIKAFKTLLGQKSGGWFKLENVPQRDYRGEYPDTVEAQNTFVGVKLKFTATMLDFQVPFFGSTGGDGKGFTAFVTSFLGREPTFQECMSFMEERRNRIKSLSGTNWADLGDTNNWPFFPDNGC